MAAQKRIKVRGKQRAEIDAWAFLRVLLTISEHWSQGAGDDSRSSPDAFRAAIEDSQEPPR